MRAAVLDNYDRAAPLGTGHIKVAGNYAASLMAAGEAEKKGFTQVLWLDARERRYVEEVGTMNIFFVFGDKLVTLMAAFILVLQIAMVAQRSLVMNIRLFGTQSFLLAGIAGAGVTRSVTRRIRAATRARCSADSEANSEVASARRRRSCCAAAIRAASSKQAWASASSPRLLSNLPSV